VLSLTSTERAKLMLLGIIILVVCMDALACAAYFLTSTFYDRNERRRVVGRRYGSY